MTACFQSLVGRWRHLAAVLLLLGLTACATGPTANPKDPLEPMNRSVTAFNDKLLDVVVKPVANTYVAVVPSVVRTGVTNVFNNLRDAWSMVNGIFQLRPDVAANDLMRVAVNSFFGIGGLINVADALGMPRYNEDFGKTMGRWGVPSGPYLVLPLLGPSTVRDSVGLFVDGYKGDPVTGLKNVPARNSLYGLRMVDTAAGSLGGLKLLDQIALDKYTFLRDAYLKKRQASIYTGKKPKDDDEDDSYTDDPK